MNEPHQISNWISKFRTRLEKKVSVRVAMFMAMLVGMVVPAFGLLLLDAEITKQLHEPLSQQARQATMAMVDDVLGTPLAAQDEIGVQNALRNISKQPQVCGVSLIEDRANVPPRTISQCPPNIKAIETKSIVYFLGQRVGEIHVAFNDGDLQVRLQERRRKTLALVLVQVVVGLLAISLVLYIWLLKPIKRLQSQAEAIGERAPFIDQPWPQSDEIGELGRQLNRVHEHLDGMFQQVINKNAELRRMAMYDSLTNLPNRVLFKDLFEHAARLAQRKDETLTLLFVDLDRFKTVNDALGHAAGDDVLIQTANRLTQAVRRSDIVCRQSGDEFLILLREPHQENQLVLMANRLIQTLNEPTTTNVRGEVIKTHVSASIGIAFYPQDGKDFDTLVRHADMAMYQSKHLGRGRFTFYDTSLNDRFLSRAGVESDLGHALRRQELSIRIQPLFRADTLELCGGEALLRWIHPQKGVLPPASFISIAEDSGLLREFDAWTLVQVCEQIKTWKRAGIKPVPIAINISALQFRDQGLLEVLQRAMNEHMVEPGEIELELTESVLLGDTAITQDIMARLRKMGISLVVDDFGTGYSSLSYLKTLRPDKLKIDKSFVSDLSHDQEDKTLVEVILRMARSFGVKVTAEGVETLEQRDTLLDLGCDYLQGFLLGYPMEVSEFTELLRQPKRIV